MSTHRRTLLALAAAATAWGIALPTAALAQSDYPSKPIKIIVAFPPGGTSDVMGRLVAEPLAKALGQPVVIENVGGAGGTIGTDRGVKAPADGYTIIQTGVGQNAVAHGLDPNLKYDSVKDFIHISHVHSGPNVLVVNAAQPYKTLAELVKAAKSNPGKLDYGYTHAASGHMAMELFKQTAGIYMTGIPYRGGGPMMTALLGNEIPMMFINQDVALPHIKAGKLRPLAVSSTKRNNLYPDVPTVAESGYPGFEALSWSGMSVAAGTPAPVVAKLEAAFKEVMESPAIKTKLEGNGFVVPQQGTKAYSDFVTSEKARWTQVIQKAGIKPQ
jgi:tripartite-type tricarboxylate transporter receptor subunit TctC